MKRNFLIVLLLFLITSFSVPAFAQLAASFTTDITEGCAPLVVKFEDQSVGNPTTWRWEMGNGSILFLSDPATTYFEPGIYTVKLVITNGNQQDSVIKTNLIRVYPPPIANFNASITTGCFPLPIQFTDLSTPESGSLVKWEWDFGDGFSSDEQHPAHTYDTIGNYHVSLRVTNSNGCTNTISRLEHIKISTGAKADFELTAPANCRPPTLVNFIDKSVGTGTLSYLWDFGDGSTSVNQNPSYSYTATGNYTISLTITNDFGCVNQVIKSNAINIGSVKADFISPDQVCAGQPLFLTNTSNPIPSGAKWDFGNGQVSNDLNPTYIFPERGTYLIKLESSFGNCSDTLTKTIEVLDKPTVDFTADNTHGCEAPMTVSFRTQTSETLTYKWDFGDGDTSVEKNPQHTYNSEGDFTVTLVATNSIGCTETITRNNYIAIKKAIVQFDPLAGMGCVPLQFTPVANVQTPEEIADYRWDFGDGFTSTEKLPVHEYTTAGTYNIKLIYTTASGCTDSAFVPTIKVGDKPALGFGATPTITCAFKPVGFIDMSAPPAIDTWLWNFGDGSQSELKNPNHYYSDTGYFDVTLVGWSNGCADTLTLEDMVYIRAPIAKFADSTTCETPFKRWFLDNSIGAKEWYWDFGDGTNANIQYPDHTYANNGNYIVSLTVRNDTCEHTFRKQIRIYSAKKDFTASATLVCTGVAVKFSTTGTDPTYPPSAFWDFGDGATQSGPLHIDHIYALAGEYTVKLVVTDVFGCQETITKPLYIKVEGPHAGFSTTTGTVCANSPIIFTDTSSANPAQPIVSWIWDYGDGANETLSGGPFQHAYKEPGKYNVGLTVEDVNGCRSQAFQYSSFTITKPVSLFESPDSLSCTKKPIRFLNNSSQHIAEYQWTFGDGRTSSDQQPSITYTKQGSYAIELITKDIFGCKDTLVKLSYINIRDPRALFTVNDSIATCPPLVVQFTNKSENFNSYEWNFGDNSRPAPTENPGHFYSFPGTYIAKLRITSPGGCIDSMEQELVVSGPKGDFTYDVLSGCYPLTVNFSGSTTTGASFVWDYNDGLVEPGYAEMTHTYTDTGSYLPKMILVDPQGCRVPFPGPDTIKAYGATASFEASTTVLCDSGVVNFTDLSSANEEIIGHNWSFGPGQMSSDKNPSWFYRSKGKHPVELIVTTRSGCKDTLTSEVPITIAEKPIVAIEGDSVVCMPGVIQFRGAILESDTTLEWQWDFGNGSTAGSQYPVSAIYNEPKNYDVQLTATSGFGCRDTVLKTISPLPLPTVNAGEDKTIAAGSSVQVLTTHSPDVTSLTWKPATGLNCTNCTDPLATPKKTTTYSVEVTNEAGCSSSDDMTISVFCDAGNLFMPNTFSPNGDGRNDVFYPRGKGLFTVKTLRIFNRWGEVVFEKKDFNANDITKGWKGFHNNRPAPPDVYIYSIDLICENTIVLNYKGNVALIR